MIQSRGVTDRVISVRQLKLVENFSSNGEIVVWLRKRGYVRYDKKILYDGKPHIVWFKDIPQSKINKHFRQSMEVENSGVYEDQIGRLFKWHELDDGDIDFTMYEEKDGGHISCDLDELLDFFEEY